MTDKHEFREGGRWIAEISEEDCCCHCGRGEARMRYNGSIAPSIREGR